MHLHDIAHHKRLVEKYDKRGDEIFKAFTKSKSQRGTTDTQCGDEVADLVMKGHFQYHQHSHYYKQYLEQILEKNHELIVGYIGRFFRLLVQGHCYEIDHAQQQPDE